MKTIPIVFTHTYAPKNATAFLTVFIGFARQVAKQNDMPFPTLSRDWGLIYKAEVAAEAIGIKATLGLTSNIHSDAGMALFLINCMKQQNLLKERIIDKSTFVLKTNESKVLPIQIYKVLFTINLLGCECVIDAGGSFEVGSTKHTVFFETAETYEQFVEYIKDYLYLYENELPFNEPEFVIKAPDFINPFFTYRQDFVFDFINNIGKKHLHFGGICEDMVEALKLPPRVFGEHNGSDAKCADIIVSEYLAYMIRCAGMGTKAKGFANWLSDNEKRLRNGNINLDFVLSNEHSNKLNKGAKALFKTFKTLK